jgi:hypothetical protein
LTPTTACSSERPVDTKQPVFGIDRAAYPPSVQA